MLGTEGVNCFVYNTEVIPKGFAFGNNCRIYALEFLLQDYKRSITNLEKCQIDIAFYLETKFYSVICTEKYG